MVGTTISHYKVLEKIGEGGMGEVYLAWLKVAPEYEKLRSDPRYQQLLTRIGLSR